MNKIFKVVWSKTKECYVVVSEVAKNNSGKKKVLASVLATLAIMGAGAQMGTPVQAVTDLRYSAVNIAPDSVPAGYGPNSVSSNSIVVGYGNNTKTGAQGNGHVAYGFNNTATEDTTTALGGGNKATGPAATAIGSFNEATGRSSVAIGNVSKANNLGNIAIGSYANAQTSGTFTNVNNQVETKGYAVALGGYAAATEHGTVAVGSVSKASGFKATAVGAGAQATNNQATAVGNASVASGENASAFGYNNKVTGDNSTALGTGNTIDGTSVAGAVAVGNKNNASGDRAIAIGETNTSKVEDTITMGTSNTASTGGGIAIGKNNLADSTNRGTKTGDGRGNENSQIAIGRDNEATHIDTVAVGREVKSTGTGAVGLGSRINATGDYAVAIGNSSAGGTVEAADYAVAVGFKAKATGGRSIAQGGAATAAAERSIAMGLKTNVTAQKANSTYSYSGTGGALVGGVNTSTKTIHSTTGTDGANDIYGSGDQIAIGSSASVSDESNAAVVIGKGAKTEGNAHYSVVVGKGSYANASDGVVVGQDSYVKARESVAIGQGANVSNAGNVRSQAIGFGATVTGTNAYDATAIGATAQVTDVTGGVALGSGSESARKTSDNENVGWNSKYVDGTKVRNRAYTSTGGTNQWDDGLLNTGAVSVGNDTQKRQIINVAAGNQDTDAVNVAQLKNVGVRVGADTNTATIGTNKVAADFLAYNGQLNIKGDNNRVTTVSENDANGKDANVNVKFDYDGLVKSKTGSAVTVDQKTDGNGKTYFEIDAAAASKTVLADGKNTTVTGAGTTASPYKVNVEGALTGISSITNNTGGKIEFTTGGTTISGGPVNVSNNKITGVADGDVSSTSKDAVNGSQLHAVKTAERHIAPTTAGHEYTVDSNGDVTMTYLDGNNNAVTGEQAVIKGIAKNDLSNITNAGKKEITKLGTIVKAGDNVNVSESSDATTGRTTYTVNAVTPAVYTKADGTKVVKRPNGTFTTNLDGSAGNDVDKDDVITSFMDGNGNTTGGNMVINNVGSAIDKTGTSTGDTFLTKLNTAATNTPNAAVNVRDLKTTSDALVDKGLKFTGNNTGTENAHKLGSLVKVQGEGVAATDVPSFASAAGNIAVVANGTDTLELKLNKNLKGINSVSNGSSSITLNSNPGGTNNTPAVQITGGNLSMGDGTTNNKIVNLAPGTNDTDAVNYSQIKGLRTEVKQGANVTVSKTQGTDGHDIYTISAAATGGTASSWNIKSSADTANGGATATDHNANAVNISDQKTVEMVAGKNLTVKQGATTDGAKVEFALSDKIGIGEKGQPGVPGKDGVDGKIGVNGKDGSSVVINGADGSIGMTGPQGKDGKDGINGRDGANISMTSAKGEQVLINRDPAHSADTDKAERIVYVPKDASGNPIKGADNKNIVREVATMDDGLKFGGDMGTVGAVKLNKQVDVKGGITDVNKLATGNNIGVTSVPDTTTGNTALNIQLAKDITGLNSVQIGGNTIKTDGDHITITSPDTTPGAAPGATTTNKVANLADEKHIKEGTYAVANDGSVTLNYQDGNKKDLTETAKITGIAKQDLSNITNDGKKEITKLGTIVKAGDNVTVTSASDGTTGRTTYTVNAVTPAIYTDKNGNKVVKRPDGTYTTNLDGSTGNDVAANDVIVSFKDAAGNTTGGNSIINNVGSAIKNQTPTMPAGQTATYLDKLKAAADDTKTQNAAVNVSDLHNTANALRDSELHIAPTAVKSGSTEVKGGALNAAGTENVYKYDAATKKVTLTYNDGNGKAVTDTKAVIDFSALNTGGTTASTWTAKTSAENTTAGSEVGKHAGNDSQVIGNQNSVDFQAGRNMTVKQTNDGNGNTTINYALDKDLTNLDKVVVNGKDGQAGQDGVTIVGPQGATGAPGMPGTNGIDGKVGISGKDGKDAVFISGKDGVGHIGLTGPQGPAGTPGAPGTPGANIDISTDHGTQTLVKPEANNNNQSERIVYVPKDSQGNPLKDTDGNTIKREVATMDDGLKFTGNNESTVNSHKLNTLVKVQGEGTKEGTNAAGTKEIQTSDGTKFESAKDNIAVEANNGDTLTVKLNKNLKGLDSVQTKTVELGDHTTPGGTTNITYNSGDKRIEYTTPGAAGTPETKKVATTDDLWTIQGNGTDVAPVNGKVNVKAGENILITTPNTADGSMTINAVTPAVYTDKDGNKLTKDKDGKFHKPDGTEVAAADVITSIQDAAGNVTGGNSIVNNVGSAINNHATPGVTSPTYLDKLDAAAGDTKTQNAAVNVTDLKNTADGLTDKGLNFTGNNESTVNKHKLGSLVKVQGEGTKEGTDATGAKEIQTSDGTKFESAKDNIAVEADSIDKLTIKLNKNLKGINSISNGSTSITLNDAPNATTPAVTIKGGNLSMGDGTTNNKIVNLAPGTADTDAVNYGQIKGLRTEVKPGSNIVVNKTQDSTDGHDIYTISATATGGTASSWNIKSSADTANSGATATGHDANAVNISDQKTVEMVAGKNLTVKQTSDTNGAKVEFALSDNIVAGKDGANGKDGSVGATGKDGSSVVINGADGSIGMTGPKGQDGKDGINGRDGADISITSAKGEQVLINRDPAHSLDTDKAERIVYVPKDANGDPIKGADNKNIVREVATMDDGLKFGGDMGTVNSVKLNKQVDVKGGITDTNKLATGNNIGVTSGIDPTTNNATLNVQLAKDLTGLNSVELGGNTIKTDGDHITITSPDTTPGAAPGATTTNKVANLADELHIEDKTYTIGDTSKRANAAKDEVTLTYKDGNGAEVAGKYAIIKGVANSDLSNISNDGKKNITKLGSIVKAGDNITVSEKSDATTGQKTYTVNAVTPAVYTKADGTKVYKIVDPTTGAVTWNTSADGTGTPVNANEVIASFETPATGTTPGATTGGTMIVNNIGSAISGHEAKDTAGTVITSPTYLQRLETAAGDNLTKHAAVNVSDLNSAAKELKASELHIAPTAVKSGSTEVKGGVASGTENVYKYDATTKKVTLTYNDGNGKAVTDTKAVIDFSDLNIPAGGNNYGFKANATANGGAVANDATTPAVATAVESGGTVNFAAGKNLTVKQDIDATNKTQTYTFSLDKDLTNLDKVVVNGNDGATGQAGVSIVGPKGANGVDGNDGKVGISGKDGKDAVSISGKDGVGHIGLTGPAGTPGAPGTPGTPGANIDISTDHGTQTLVKPEANNNNKSERIVYVPKDANGNPLKDTDGNDIKREVATMDDGLRFTGNNTSKENKQPMNSLVKVQGEGVTENAAGKLEVNGQEFKSAAGNIAVEADGQNTLTVKMNKDLNLTKDGSVTMGDTVVNNDGITIKAPTTPGTTTTDVKLTNQGLDNGGNKITNVAAGTANTDAVNVKQLKDNVTTVTSSDSSIKVVDKNDPTSATYDATKGHQYDITVNNQGVVNNAQTPVVYTKEDGTKVYKQPDGTFTTNINGTGTVVPANQVIASMNSAGNSSTDPTKLQNVGSSIADKTGTTFLDKINTAAGDPNAKYGAVNVTDLKSTSDALIDKGLVFDANNQDPKTNKLGSKVTIAGSGALGTTENFADKYNTDNIRTNIEQDGAGNTTVKIGLNKNLKGLESVSVPGKDGVDGQDGVSITGKDGANGVDGKVSIGKDGKDAVSISGKDGIGHIGLTGAAGKDGTNTKADITVKEGQPGLNGTDGITRIVYKDKDGNDHEVATHDDGVKYAGDDAQGTDKTKVISKKLNETIDIVGGADKTKLTDNNIGVNNDGGKLIVQLANELAGINKISNGGSSITFNSNPGGATNTPAVQISGGDLNMGGNKITNLKKGSDVSDAATVGQLTKVKSSNNSVGITESTDANGAKVYDLSVTGVPGADPRVDKLGEEIGRVGAQGAALAALKPIQYDPLEPTQIMAGYGNYRGNSAIAMGVAHYKNESTMMHAGLAWAGGSRHMMANAGVTWKVGNRDSEAAVADRYRKGPISSTYAMQQEMAAMKAQNAGLKGEVSDLKAENEQMKAQIAAMMAKLGL